MRKSMKKADADRLKNRFMSLVLSFVILLTTVDVGVYVSLSGSSVSEDVSYNIALNDIKEITFEANGSININSDIALKKLSNVSPSEYQNRDINCKITGNADLYDLNTDNDGIEFMGLGSADYPYSGVFSIDNKPVILNGAALFRGISTDASIKVDEGKGRLSLSESFSNPDAHLFADDIVAGNNSDTLAVNVNIMENCQNFGGIIGKIAENSKVNLSVTNNVTAQKRYDNAKNSAQADDQSNDGYLRCISTNENVGFFCGSVYDDASLSISYTGSSETDILNTDMIAVKADNGNAGLAVGYSQNANIILNGNITLDGQVIASKAAGGLIGYAVNTEITIPENSTLNFGSRVGVKKVKATISEQNKRDVYYYGLSINGGEYAGGLIGLCEYNSGKEISLDRIDIKPSFISGAESDYSKDVLMVDSVNITNVSPVNGGIIGLLINDSNDSNISITGTGTENTDVNLYSNTTKSIVGGVIGEYKADSLKAVLSVQNVFARIEFGENSTNTIGGILGNTSTKNGIYAKFDNDKVEIARNTKADSFGGIVGKSEGPDFIDIGNVKMGSTLNGTNVGGVIGSMANGVLRFSGTTDLTSAKLQTTTTSGQILGFRGNVLVYALPDWQFNRPVSSTTSDIGSWGEVLRLSDKMTEIQNGLGENTNTLLDFNKSEHTVTIKWVNTNIVSERDFAALSEAMSVAEPCASLKFEKIGFDSEISLSGNINLSGTGVTGFIRDDGSQVFSGRFNGNGNTINLATGEPYGNRTTENGCGQIYNHSHNGLFAKVQGAEIKDVTIDGSMIIGCIAADKYCVYSGMAVGQVIGADCTILSEINIGSPNSSAFLNISGTTKTDKNYTTSFGGLIGIVGLIAETTSNVEFYESSDININNCTWNGEIINGITSFDVNSTNKPPFYAGGFIGAAYADSKITINESAISGKITNKKMNSSSHNHTGGLISDFVRNTSEDNHAVIDINGLTIDGLAIDTGLSTVATGGLLGYEWWNCDADFDDITIKNSSLETGGSFGGLIYGGSGHWKVGYGQTRNGIKFLSGNSFIGKTSNSNPSALFVAHGDDFADDCFDQTNKALFLEINNKSSDEFSYCIDDSVKLEVSGDSYFDEIVGRTINYENGNGVVSINTNNSKVDTDSCNTYVKQLARDYDNRCTRYYYNLDSIIEASKVKSDDWNSGQITDADMLMCYSLRNYTESYLRSYFYGKNASSIKGKIDLTGYSYYPITNPSSITIIDAEIKFDNEKIENAEKDALNKKTSDNKKQHYLMHTGLFSDVSASTEDISVSVNNSRFCGTIGSAGTLGSGAGLLINGTAIGSSNAVFSLKIDGLKLDGIRVTGYTENEYAPLLVNKIGSNSNLNARNVTIDNYSNGTIAASSFIGDVGSEDSSEIRLVFSNLELKGNKKEAIFSRATILNSFSYTGSTGMGQYTFDKDDIKTFGEELSNSVAIDAFTKKGGRNSDKQFQYLSSSDIVNDGSVIANSPQGFKNGEYLPYVYVSEKDNGKETAHELDINQKQTDIIEGSGTYDDPYVITKGEQLESLQKYLKGENPSNWKVRINKRILNQQSYDYKLEKDDYVVYSLYSADTWQTEDKTEKADANKVTQYLRNAYYQINNDITLGFSSDSFLGLGWYNIDYPSSTSIGYSFSGVITGKKMTNGNYPTITINAPSGSTEQFGGLICYSNGSVVKDLNIKYNSAVKLNANKEGSGIIVDGNEYDSNTKNSVESPVEQYPQNQTFFGGVIGYAMGGDNIIDNVTIIGLDNAVSVTDNNDTGNNETPKYSYLANIGGYVGLVGGNALGNGTIGTAGGGVVFKNIQPNVSFDVSVYEKRVSANAEANVKCYSEIVSSMEDENRRKYDGVKDANIIVEDDQYFYINPYVGRVLDGYACAENITLNNTDKNYTIPNLDTSNIGSLSIDGKTLSISDEQALWLTSAIVNSGAGSMNSSGVYSENAYHYGKVRTGDYNNIGSAITSDKGAVIDETNWGGSSKYGSDKVSYLISRYGSNTIINDDSESDGSSEDTSDTTESTETIKVKSDFNASNQTQSFGAFGKPAFTYPYKAAMVTNDKKSAVYNFIKVTSSSNVNITFSPEDTSQKLNCYFVYDNNGTDISSNTNTRFYKFTDGEYCKVIESGTASINISDLVSYNNITKDLDKLYILVSATGDGKNLSTAANAAVRNAFLKSLNLDVKVDETTKLSTSSGTYTYYYYDPIYAFEETANTVAGTYIVYNGRNCNNDNTVDITVKEPYKAKFYVVTGNGYGNAFFKYNGKYENDVTDGHVSVDLDKVRKVREDYKYPEGQNLYVLVAITPDENSTVNYQNQIDKNISLMKDIVKNEVFTFTAYQAGKAVFTYSPKISELVDDFTFATDDIILPEFNGKINNVSVCIPSENSSISDLKAPDGVTAQKRAYYKAIPLDSDAGNGKSVTITNKTGRDLYCSITDNEKIELGTGAYLGAVKIANNGNTTIDLTKYAESGLYLLVGIDTDSKANTFYSAVNGGFTVEIKRSKNTTPDVNYSDSGIASSDSSFVLSFNADCDMTSYGNGFRGIGTGYTDNITKMIKNRTLSIRTLNGNNHTITIERNGHEYSEETWWTQAEGLFPVFSLDSATSKVEDLSVSGNVRIFYIDKDYLSRLGEAYKSGNKSGGEYVYTSYDAFIGEAMLGGLGGASAYSYTDANKVTKSASPDRPGEVAGFQSNSVIFSNIHVRNLNVEGGKYCGGIIAGAGQFNRIYRKAWEKKANSGSMNWATTNTFYNPKTKGSIAGNYTFDSCGYTNLDIKGAYSVGGFIGIYKNNSGNAAVARFMKIKGSTQINGSNSFTITRDGVYEYVAHTTVPKGSAVVNADNAAKWFAYIGAGGIVGYCDSAFYINNDNVTSITTLDAANKLNLKDSFTLSGLTISAPQISFNSDFGLGVVAGSIISNGGYANPVVACNVTVEKSYVGTPVNNYYFNKIRTSDSKMTYPTNGIDSNGIIHPSFRNYNAGGIFGYAKSTVYVYNCTVDDVTIINSPYTGGIVSNKADNKLYIFKADVKNCLMYNNNSIATNRASGVGGLVGHLNIDSTIDDVNISGCTLISNGSTGGITGYNSNKTLIFNNISLSDNIIASTRSNSVKKYYDYDYDANTSITDGFRYEKDFKNNSEGSSSSYAFSGRVGTLFGSDSTSGGKTYGHNIMLNNNRVGFVLDENENIYTYDNSKTNYKGLSDKYPLTSLNNLDKKGIVEYVKDPAHIGVAKSINAKTSDSGSSTYISYKNAVFTKTNKYNAGYDGKIIGYGANSDVFKFTAVSIQGDYQPTEYNGNAEAASVGSYIIRADYTGKSLGNNPHTVMENINDSAHITVPSTANGVNTSNTFVNSNPFVGLPFADVSGLTSDGISAVIRNSIVSDAANGSDNFNKIYSSSYNSKNTLNEFALILANSGKLKTLSEVDASHTGVDIPVILIDTNNSRDINELIQKYISVMTGVDQTLGSATDNSGEAYKSLSTANKHLYDKVVANTYSLENGIWRDTGCPSIEISGTGESTYFRSISGRHDNGHDNVQFTLLDVQFASPSETGKIAYHLYIPIYVKRVMAFSFYASVLNDTDYYAQHYLDTDIHVIANYDDKITAYLSYNYYRSAQEWQDSINGGENLLWNFNKRVYLGSDKIPDDSVMTLVDHNTGGYAYTLTVKNELENESNSDSNVKCDVNGYYIDLDKFTESIGRKNRWDEDAVRICDLLGISASPVSVTAGLTDYSGYFAITDGGDALATIRVRNPDGGFTYYRPANSSDIVDDGTNTSFELYRISIDSSKVKEAPIGKLDTTNISVVDGKVSYIEESYFLTIQAKSDVLSNRINNALAFPIDSLGKAGYIGTDSSFSMPTANANKGVFVRHLNENRYIFSKCLEIDFDISTRSDENTYVMTEENSSITATLKSKININDNEIRNYITRTVTREDGTNTIDAIRLFQGFTISLDEIDGDSSVHRNFENECLIDYQFTVKGLVDNREYVGKAFQMGAEGSLILRCDENLTDSAGNQKSLMEILDLNTPKDNVSGNGGIEVTCFVKVSYTSDGVEKQFPERESTSSNKGIQFKGETHISFSESSLLTSALKRSKQDISIYYREKISAAKLTYSAMNIADGDSTGIIGVGQLGMNAIDPENNYPIKSIVHYDFSNIASEDLSRAKTVKYGLKLYVKDNDTDRYIEDLIVNNYLFDLTIDGESPKVSENGKILTYVKSWDNTTLPSQTIEVDYDVLTGDEFEIKGYTYSNYRVVVSAQLYDDDEKLIDGTDDSDYLIYTNARNILEMY